MYLVRGLLVAAAFNLPFVSGMGIQATPLPASVTPPPNNDAAVNPSTVVWFETDNGVTYSVFSDGGGLASVPIQNPTPMVDQASISTWEWFSTDTVLTQTWVVISIGYVTPSASPAPEIIFNPGDNQTTSSSIHHTRTVLLATLLSLFGAVGLIAALLMITRFRNRRAMLRRRSWALRPAGWTQDQKVHPDAENITMAPMETYEPPSPPARASTHERKNSIL